MKKNFRKSIIGLAMLLCLSLSVVSVNAATYSKTKSINVNYGEQISAIIYDTATKNTTSGDWSFSLRPVVTSSKNGYTFGKAYTSSTVKTNNGNTVTHKVGYYFYNSLGNSTGGGTKSVNFTYSGGSVS